MEKLLKPDKNTPDKSRKKRTEIENEEDTNFYLSVFKVE